MPAGADPDLALRLAKEVSEVYGQAVDELLAIVARRVASGIDEAGWAERKLLELAGLRDEARAVVDRLEVAGPEAVATSVRAGWLAGTKAGEAEVGIAFGHVATAAVDVMVHETVTAVSSTHLQILRSVDDAYRAIISQAANQTVTGTLTRRQATQRALDQFADRGITGFIDQTGRNWQLDTYAEMATRTATGRAQVAGTLDQFQAAGRDLVIISDSAGECHLCRPYEGQVFSISGADPSYPPLESASGLFHANCRHQAGAYIDGLTRPMKHTADPDGDAARQQQRYLERGVRQWKRRGAVAIDDQGQRQAAARVREWSARLDEHVKANDLKRLRYRER